MTSVEQSTPSLTKPTVTTTTQSILITAFVGLLVPFAIVLLVVAVLTPVPWWLAILVAVGLAGGVVFWRSKSAGLSQVSSVGAIPTNGDGAEARLVNLLEGLSLTSGISTPQVYIVHDEALNAGALICGGEPYLLATTGLVEKLSRIELEGVAAELVARIKSGDVEVSTLSSALYGPLVTGPFAPVTSSLGTWLLSRIYVPDRDLLSDGAAVMLTRYPPGLLSALEKIKASSSQVPGALVAYDSSWFVSPRPSDGQPTYSQDSDIGLRIDVLAEL